MENHVSGSIGKHGGDSNEVRSRSSALDYLGGRSPLGSYSSYHREPIKPPGGLPHPDRYSPPNSCSPSPPCPVPGSVSSQLLKSSSSVSPMSFQEILPDSFVVVPNTTTKEGGGKSSRSPSSSAMLAPTTNGWSRQSSVRSTKVPTSGSTPNNTNNNNSNNARSHSTSPMALLGSEPLAQVLKTLNEQNQSLLREIEDLRVKLEDAEGMKGTHTFTHTHTHTRDKNGLDFF